MKLVVPIITLLLGLAIPFFLQSAPLEGVPAVYLAVACVAGLDTVSGGIRSGLEGKFRNDVFLSGFIANVSIAFFLAWLGDQIGINLYLVAAIVLGTRIFTNLSLIRRMLLTRWHDERERRRRKDAEAQAQSATPQSSR